MRNVTYFPPYSQEENVVTNAVLLLLSHVHRLAPNIFAELMTALTEVEYEVGPTFENQIKVKGGRGIPDALIKQSPFEIYIETKLGDDLNIEQIKAHFETIKTNETIPGSSILIGLTRSSIDSTRKKILCALGDSNRVRFFSTTFSDIADVLEKASSEFRLDLNLILEEYRAFIQERGLIPASENKLLINPCGTSYDQNKQHGIYHDQPARSKVFCKYLGIYKNKSVSLVGRVLAVVNARIENNNVIVTENHPLGWTSGKLHQITDDEKKRILGIVNNSPYYNLRGEEARYYVVESFVETDFQKVSKQGIQGHRYFTLDGEDGIIPELFRNEEPSVEQVAQALETKSWI